MRAQRSHSIGRRQTVGHAVVDKARLFYSRNDLDRMAERPLRTGNEIKVLMGAANRAGAGRANAARAHVPEALAKTRQAVQSSLSGIGGNFAVFG